MIFVSLGSQKFPFNRLLRAVDDLVEQGEIQEPVFAQIGSSDYEPRHYKYERFLDADAFSSELSKADMLITHAGTGVILRAVKNGKKIVVVPRQKKFGEHVDDHQAQIAQMFAELGYVICCNECDELKERLREARALTFQPYKSNTGKYLDEIDSYLQSL